MNTARWRMVAAATWRKVAAATGRNVAATAPAYSLALAALVFGPLFGSGCLLLRDAVSTPRSYLTDSALGLGDAAPRAVPQDALLAVLSPVIGGCLAVKVILLLALWLAGWGAARMVGAVLPALGTGATLVAATVAIWNPYVAERLLQGHWSLLAGYAALPWTVVAALRVRRRAGWQAWAALALCLTAAALTPTGALLAAVTAAAIVGIRGLPGLLILTVLASTPWLVAAALSGAGAESDPAGVAAFAARAEPGLGTLAGLAGLGGIWNADAVPGSRTSLFAVVATLVLLVVVAVGVPVLWRRRVDPVVRGLGVLTVAAVLLPALAATPPGMEFMRWAVEHVPGWGLLRDTQKWVALAMPGYALSAAAGCAWLGARFRNAVVPALVSIVALIAVLPDLAWGVGGALRPVHYPGSWHTVAGIVERSNDDTDVAALPAGMFRIFPWSGSAPVLDPSPRILPRDVLQTGQLPVRGAVVAGEGSRASEVEAALLAGDSPRRLAELGVGWVLEQHTSVGPVGESHRTLAELEQVYRDDELTLYRVPGAAEDRAEHRWLAVFAHLVWAVLLAGSALLLLVEMIRRRRAGRSNTNQS
ncbi:hypothetical protein OG921_07665 [Aldersonia sp. NBC_00410]|uniref:hypothetical protein n=1 Tax=Aldersonia sp. NBC_00410 TaxID=2975954 RepID=UPI00224CD630|nr:hypothetical protein [Aldersonia sp. NBC_00410]MCX5043045.1 hypothetical protein [Aldersonia sp. NBC_00410]